MFPQPFNFYLTFSRSKHQSIGFGYQYRHIFHIRLFQKNDTQNRNNILEVRIHCCGPTGHGSLLLENTAGEKMRTVLNAFLDYRESQVLKMKNSKSVELAKIAEVTSINLTELKVILKAV